MTTWLEENRPPEQRPLILHGDYHLDNCLWGTDRPRLLAIIDWELSTIGDPLLDVGLCLALWGDRPTESLGLARIQSVSRTAAAPGREGLAQRYAERSGRSLDAVVYYVTLALWKLVPHQATFARFTSSRSVLS